MIIHKVSFKLKHVSDSEAERTFLAKGRVLAAIETVQNFRCLQQVSPKNPYDFCFSMEFADQAASDFYNQPAGH